MIQTDTFPHFPRYSRPAPHAGLLLARDGPGIPDHPLRRVLGHPEKLFSLHVLHYCSKVGNGSKPDSASEPQWHRARTLLAQRSNPRQRLLALDRWPKLSRIRPVLSLNPRPRFPGCRRPLLGIQSACRPSSARAQPRPSLPQSRLRQPLALGAGPLSRQYPARI